ncbi:MAG: Ku protein, partial [Candidatus Nanopelagicales bacterium]
EEKDISLRQVHEADGGRIKYKRVCSIDGEEVAYSNIAKGYEVTEGEIVILNDEDFSNLPIASTKTVEVLSFADADEINPIALSRAYYADPSGDAKPYVLLRDTLISTNKVAIVKVALRQKERLATIRAQDGVLVVHTMLWPDEVRAPAFGFMNEDVGVRPQELEMASTYVEAFNQGFDADEYHDDYREALNELVQAKISGHELTKPPPSAEPTNVVDLMDALRASVAAADSSKGKRVSAPLPRDRTAASRKTLKKSAAKTKSETTTKKATAKKSTAKKAAKKTTKKVAKKTAKRAAS